MNRESCIRVEALAKRYELGVARHDTLRDRIAHALRTPLRRWRGVPASDTSEFWALRDVSFEVKRGEVLGVIGRNGAGKSTLLKILSRITEPTSGRISIRGRVASLLEVGTGFHPELTGRENIFLNGAILGMSRAEIRRKFDQIVAFADVERFLDTPVKHYSSGMYVRLAFAVAAHLEPEILIVDEVLAVGDAEFQAKCLGKMESIAQAEGRTILFVSHNMSAVVRLCHRAVLLERGRVVLDDRADVAVNRYLSQRSLASAAAPAASLAHDGYTTGAPIQLQAVVLNGGAAVVNRQPLRARIEFAAHRPVEAVGFGVGICGLDGRRILTVESDYAGRFFRVAAAGAGAVEFTLPVVDLAPGRYFLDVGAYDAAHRAFHYAAEFATLEIQAGAETPAHLHGVNGDFRPQAAWEMTG
jgi:lipopolysaccharide transport system ATP-binding protein